LAELIDKHWDALGGSAVSNGKASKKEAKGAVPAEVAREAKALLDGRKAVDVALFGRMLADLPEVNRDAACQVAHAISTHKVDREFDYFTAVDDMGEADETGAGMIGQVEFNSATYYRYAVIDAGKLLENLQGDRELTLAAIEAFTKAIARAIPSGKQNSFAAHNPPSFVGVALRQGSPFNLANAFEKPVWAKADRELTAMSVERLAAHDSQVTAFYGIGKEFWGYLDMTGAWPSTKGETQTSLEALAGWVRQQVGVELES
jgi:CRISPR system Cascade subunit CasC